MHKKIACKKFIGCQSPETKKLARYQITISAVEQCEKEIAQIYDTFQTTNDAEFSLTTDTQ